MLYLTFIDFGKRLANIIKVLFEKISHPSNKSSFTTKLRTCVKMYGISHRLQTLWNQRIFKAKYMQLLRNYIFQNLGYDG